MQLSHMVQQQTADTAIFCQGAQPNCLIHLSHVSTFLHDMLIETNNREQGPFARRRT